MASSLQNDGQKLPALSGLTCAIWHIRMEETRFEENPFSFLALSAWHRALKSGRVSCQIGVQARVSRTFLGSVGVIRATVALKKVVQTVERTK